MGLHRGLGGSHRQLHPELIIPTGPVKKPPTGSGLPNRFDRKPVEFKSKFKIACVNGSDRYTGRFDRFTGVLTKKSDSVKVVPRFDRFTGCHMWWALMGRPIFFLFF